MAMILDAFLSKFSELLLQMVQAKVGGLLGIPGQIKKLGETVRDIQCVLADAERKQSKGSAIEWWLMQLKDVMYDADDIIDLCQIKAKDRLAGSSSHSSSNAHCGCPLLSCFRNPFFAHKIGSKIKDINSRLEGIAKRKDALGLIVSQISPGPSDPVHRVDSIITHETDPLVVDDIVGEKIEEDTEMLVNWLTEEEKSAREIILVLAIVGMGGIGKTTLASKIFNDRRIEEEFQLKIWVCVSKEVKGAELLKCMIREAGGEHGAAQKRSELAPILKRLVEGKKFLLVLDDVWEESRAVWNGLLRTPMSGGAHGSRLLVTTRDERVADGMKAAKLHRVEKLSDEDGWSLLIKQVFQNEKENEIQEFKDIGLQLVEKCDGLPLAIKTIGGVLCTKLKTKVNWQAVLNSNMWSIAGMSSIHNAFHLSYEDLSSPLKQCFIFCSLFPEDFEFNQIDLIYQWLAEGYLRDKVDSWELGNEYYKELLVRNLLEDTGKFYNQEQCKMHDLLWSFARQLGKDENYVLREDEQVLFRPAGSLKIRRLSIEGNKVNIELFKKENGLRTLFLRDEPEISLDYVCKAFSNLRMLDLNCSNFSSLPDSLCNLMHLRYLDVADSKIRNLPYSIGNLKYLVYLNLAGCQSLSDVPRSITNLQELKFLNTNSSGIKGIPVGLNKLDKLVQLLGIRPDKNSLEGFSSLDSIEALSQLIKLKLNSLEKVSDKNIANRANLLNKGHLQNLWLFYSTLSSEEQLSQTNEKKMTTEDVLNELCPPLSLELVEIVGYFGSHLPNWLNLTGNLPNLRYINIENCACFEELALLGQLPNLDYLQIKGAYSVVTVGEEFLWGGIQNRDTTATSCQANKSAFPKLSKLIFDEMPNWKEWEWNKGQVAMPKLKELFISDCPQLRSLPEGLLHHATSLEYLEIDRDNKMTTVENLQSIKDIRVFSSPNLERISNLPSISYILIEECPNLKAVENLKALHTMGLTDYEMEILPNYLRMTMPQKLRIHCSEELLVKIVSQVESGSEWNKFKHIPKVTIYSSDESLNATYRKTPFSFTTNVCTSSEMMRQQGYVEA